MSHVLRTNIVYVLSACLCSKKIAFGFCYNVFFCSKCNYNLFFKQKTFSIYEWQYVMFRQEKKSLHISIPFCDFNNI